MDMMLLYSLLMAGMAFLLVMAFVAHLDTAKQDDAVLERVRTSIGHEPTGFAGSILHKSTASPLAQMIGKLGAVVSASDNEKDKSRLRSDLLRAGYRDPAAPEIFAGLRMILTVALPLLTFSIIQMVASGSPLAIKLLLIIGLAYGGYRGPQFFLDLKIKQREEAVRLGLAEAIDILTICVTAGLGLMEGFRRVAEEYRSANPVIADEFLFVFYQMQFGTGREAALKGLANRVAIDEVNGLIGLINQSEKFGTGILKTLKVSAKELRRKRLLAAEDKANKLPVKVSLVVSLLIMPATMTVLLTPTVLRIMKNFAGQ